MLSQIDKYVIDKVKTKRVAAKLSQEVLSEKAGFKSNGFIAQVESGKYFKRYNINHINIFASIFECSPKEFLPDLPL